MKRNLGLLTTLMMMAVAILSMATSCKQSGTKQKDTAEAQHHPDHVG